MENIKIESNSGEIRNVLEDGHKLDIKNENEVAGAAVGLACLNSSVATSYETSQEYYVASKHVPTYICKDLPRVSHSRKERKKLNKRKLAEEKKRKREEEYRKKLVPKDQKVTLVNQDLLNVFGNTSSDDVRRAPRKCHDNSLPQGVNDFPALGVAHSKLTREERGKREFQEPAHFTGMSSCSSTTVGQSCELDVAASTVERQTVTSSKRAHWRNTVMVDLLSFAKNQSALKEDEDKKKQTVRAKKDSKPVLCGNPLDASNPERKRGKFREKKKVKMSSLKRIIREELEKRRKEKAELADGIKNGKVLCAKSFDELLSMLQEHLKALDVQQSRADVETTHDDCGSDTDTSVVMFESLKKKTSAENMLVESSPTVQNGSYSLIKPKYIVHSRKFREYCDHFVTCDINTRASELIRELLRLQDRQYQRDPIKAHSKRKYVVGLHETRKYLALKKVKLLIIATDIEKIESAGGLNDIISQLKEMAAVQNVPCVFALQRRKIGYLTLKKGPVSCLGVLNYQACEVSLDFIYACNLGGRFPYALFLMSHMAQHMRKCLCIVTQSHHLLLWREGGYLPGRQNKQSSSDPPLGQ